VNNAQTRAGIVSALRQVANVVEMGAGVTSFTVAKDMFGVYEVKVCLDRPAQSGDEAPQGIRET
jgi:hypothetical protein